MEAIKLKEQAVRVQLSVTVVGERSMLSTSVGILSKSFPYIGIAAIKQLYVRKFTDKPRFCWNSDLDKNFLMNFPFNW